MKVLQKWVLVRILGMKVLQKVGLDEVIVDVTCSKLESFLGYWHGRCITSRNLSTLSSLQWLQKVYSS